jgi:hypothetical protein
MKGHMESSSAQPTTSTNCQTILDYPADCPGECSHKKTVQVFHYTFYTISKFLSLGYIKTKEVESPRLCVPIDFTSRESFMTDEVKMVGTGIGERRGNPSFI